MAVTPGACGQRMYPLQMQSLGYRAMHVDDLAGTCALPGRGSGRNEAANCVGHTLGRGLAPIKRDEQTA
jgi:hypothetical protein